MRFDRKTFVRQKDFVLFIGKPDPLFVSSGFARRCSGLIVLNGELQTTNRIQTSVPGEPRCFTDTDEAASGYGTLQLSVQCFLIN